jgi:hypothetical protein
MVIVRFVIFSVQMRRQLVQEGRGSVSPLLTDVG